MIAFVHANIKPPKMYTPKKLSKTPIYFKIDYQHTHYNMTAFLFEIIKFIMTDNAILFCCLYSKEQPLFGMFIVNREAL